MDKQKDFEKGWEEYKEKKKQEIKEIAEVICGCASTCTDEEWDECDKMADCVRVKKIAKALHLAGYRKIPENAVVLTEKELKEKIDCCDVSMIHHDDDGKRYIEYERYENFTDRIVKVYNLNGELMATYEGQIDLATEDGCIQFEYNGKRIIWYNAIVEVVEK